MHFFLSSKICNYGKKKQQKCAKIRKSVHIFCAPGRYLGSSYSSAASFFCFFLLSNLQAPYNTWQRLKIHTILLSLKKKSFELLSFLQTHFLVIFLFTLCYIFFLFLYIFLGFIWLFLFDLYSSLCKYWHSKPLWHLSSSDQYFRGIGSSQSIKIYYNIQGVGVKVSITIF